MRFRFALVTALLVSFSALPAIAQRWGRPRPPRAGACFYKESGFRGDYFCLKVGERWPTLPAGFNDRISSIRVFRDARVGLFNDSNFRGVNMRIERDVDTLKNYSLPDNPSKNWNDRVSSIAVYQDQDDFDQQHPRDSDRQDRRDFDQQHPQ